MILIPIIFLVIYQQMPQTPRSGLLESAMDWIDTNSGRIGIVLSLAGLLLSILGFYILWRQTRKIRTAAQAAASATEHALRAISDTDTISDLSSIRERIKKVQVALRSSRFETAVIEVQTLRESLHQLRNRRGFATDESKIEIQQMVTFLRKLQTHFEKRMFNDQHLFSGAAANKALADHAAKVSEWLEKLRYLRGGDKDDSVGI